MVGALLSIEFSLFPLIEPMLLRRIALALAFSTSAPLAAQVANDGLPEPEAVQSTLEEWVETMRILSAEEADWKTEQQSLAALNEVRQRETAELAEFARAAGERVDEIAAKRAKFETDEAELKKFRREVDTRVTAMEIRLRPLISGFPPPLRSKVEESVVRIEEADVEAPLQNRVRDVLLVLQAFLDFQSEIHVEGDLREIEGQQRQVDVIYLGMARGFYVDKTNRFAGVGSPGPDGWTWTENNRLAAEVRSAIAVRMRESAPSLVELPLGPVQEDAK